MPVVELKANVSMLTVEMTTYYIVFLFCLNGKEICMLKHLCGMFLRSRALYYSSSVIIDINLHALLP